MKKYVIMILSGVVIIVLGLMVGGIGYIYEMNFGMRFDSADHFKDEAQVANSLNVTTVVFDSTKQALAGYFYESKEVLAPKGVIVVAHGLGGGHVSYLPEIKFLAESGYTVFAYDMTGCDTSGGNSMRGMPQAVVDLDHAITYVSSNTDLPILMYGHSMGGYAVMSVLDEHPEVAGVVQKSGFNSSAELFVTFGADMAGDWFKSTLPLVQVYEFLKFGSDAFASAIQGVNSSETPIMMLHSQDDSVIDYETSFVHFQSVFENRENIVYRSFEGRDHDPILSDDYYEAVNEVKAALIESYGSAENVPSGSLDEVNAQFNEFTMRYDLELLGEIVTFYDACVQ